MQQCNLTFGQWICDQSKLPAVKIAKTGGTGKTVLHILMYTFLYFFSGSYIPDCSTQCILNYNQKVLISCSKSLSPILKKHNEKF